MLITHFKTLVLLLAFFLLTACGGNSGTYLPDTIEPDGSSTDTKIAEESAGATTEDTKSTTENTENTTESSDNTINVSWDASLHSETIGYYVYHSLEPGVFSENDRTYVPDYVLTYEHVPQSSGTHYFMVTASDGFGNESNHTGGCAKTI